MKNYFITGLILIFPITLSILLTGWIFYLLSIPYFSLYHLFFDSILLSRLFSFLSVLMTLVITGFLAQYYIVKKVVGAVHALMNKLPLVRSIYHAAYEVVTVLSRDKSKGYSETVLVTHPSPTSKIVGFVPRRDVSLCPSLLNKPLIPVYVPGTVNPLMGFLIFTSEEYVKPLDMSTKDAFIWTVSLGGKCPSKW